MVSTVLDWIWLLMCSSTVLLLLHLYWAIRCVSVFREPSGVAVYVQCSVCKRGVGEFSIMKNIEKGRFK